MAHSRTGNLYLEPSREKNLSWGLLTNEFSILMLANFHWAPFCARHFTNTATFHPFDHAVVGSHYCDPPNEEDELQQGQINCRTSPSRPEAEQETEPKSSRRPQNPLRSFLSTWQGGGYSPGFTQKAYWSQPLRGGLWKDQNSAYQSIWTEM